MKFVFSIIIMVNFSLLATVHTVCNLSSQNAIGENDIVRNCEDDDSLVDPFGCAAAVTIFGCDGVVGDDVLISAACPEMCDACDDSADEIEFDPADWDTDGDCGFDYYNNYMYSGVVTAKTYLFGSDITDEGDLLAVFVDGEQRGIGCANELPPFVGGGYAFPTYIYANTDGEMLSFKFYDSSQNAVFDIDESLEFIPDMYYGDIFDLYPLTISSVPGCTDPVACNYTSYANIDDGSCDYELECWDGSFECDCPIQPGLGCTDESACNYDSSAYNNDGSCIYADGLCESCGDDGSILNDDSDSDGICDSDELVCDFITIQEAIDYASEGDTILVENGLYCENLIIQKTIYLLSRAVVNTEDSTDLVFLTPEQEAENWEDAVVIGDDDKYYIADEDINNTIIDGGSDACSPGQHEGRGLYRSSILYNSPASNGDQFDRARVRGAVRGFTIRGGGGTAVQSNGDQFDRGGRKWKGGGIYSNNSNPQITSNAIVSNGDQFDRGRRRVDRGGGISMSNGDQFDRSGSIILEAYAPDEVPPMRGPSTITSFLMNNSAISGNAISTNSSTDDTSNVDQIDLSNSHFDVVDSEDGTPTDSFLDIDENIDVDLSDITYDNEALKVDVWVATDGNDLWGWGTYDIPFQTIERAIEMVSPDENLNLTINLKSGTYSNNTNEYFPIRMYSHIDLVGAGEDITIIDASDNEGNQETKVIIFPFSENNTISDLTITGGYLSSSNPDFGSEKGAGIFVNSSNPSFNNLTIRDNTGVSGGGIYFQNSTSNLHNVNITNNLAYSGAGIRSVGSQLIMSEMTINNNNAVESGYTDEFAQGGGLRISEMSSLIIANSDINNNEGRFGGGIYSDNDSYIELLNVNVNNNNVETFNNGNAAGAALHIENTDINITNSSFLGNSGSTTDGQELGSFHTEFGTNVNVVNSILWNENLDTEITINNTNQGTGVPDVIINYSSIRGGYSGTGNIDIAPDQIPSDIGNPNAWYNDDVNDPSDLGSSGGSLVLATPIDINFGNVGNDLQVSRDLLIYNFRSETLTIDDVSFDDNATFSTNTVFPLQIESEAYGVITIDCNTSTLDLLTSQMTISSSEDAIDGATVSLTSFGISGASLSGILSGTISYGIYHVSGDIIVSSGDMLTIAPGTRFYFTGEYEFHVRGTLVAEGLVGQPIIFENLSGSDTKWKGFTLVNQTNATVFRHVRISGAQKYSGGGMALNNSTPIIENVEFSNNEALVVGGGLLISGGNNLTLKNVVIKNNTAAVSSEYGLDGFGGGGGLWIQDASNVTLEESRVINNTSNLMEGGGISIESSYNTWIKNVEITGNNSIMGGGIAVIKSDRTNFLNITISDNIAKTGGGLYIVDSEDPKITNSIIYGNTSEIGNSIVVSGNQETILNYSNVDGGCQDLLNENTGEPFQSEYSGAKCYDYAQYWYTNVGADWSYPEYLYSDLCFAYAGLGYENVIADGSIAAYPDDNSSHYCCACGGGTPITGLWDGESNTNEDPLFTNSTEGDYTLSTESNLIDAGIEYFEISDDLSIGGTSVEVIVDLDASQYNGLHPDMGAYESGQNSSTGIQGDVNADGTLNVVDLVMIIYHILNIDDTESEYILSDDQIALADTNDDGVLQVLDIVALLNSMFEVIGRTLDMVDEISIYQSSDGLHIQSSGFVALDIEISHSSAFDFSITEKAFIAASKKNDNSTRLIIVEPYSELLFATEDNYLIESIAAVGISGEIVNVNFVEVPIEIAFVSAYPNPFNPITKLDFSLPKAMDVSIIVYDMQGRQVEVLIDGYNEIGYHSIEWNADSFSSGMYFVKMIADGYVNTQKLMLVK